MTNNELTAAQIASLKKHISECEKANYPDSTVEVAVTKAPDENGRIKVITTRTTISEKPEGWEPS